MKHVRRILYGLRLAAYYAIHDPAGIRYPFKVYVSYFDRRERNGVSHDQ